MLVMGNSNSGNFRTVKMTPAQRRQAVKSYLAGKSIGDIARKYGVSTQYIYSLAHPKPRKSAV